MQIWICWRPYTWGYVKLTDFGFAKVIEWGWPKGLIAIKVYDLDVVFDLFTDLLGFYPSSSSHLISLHYVNWSIVFSRLQLEGETQQQLSESDSSYKWLNRGIARTPCVGLRSTLLRKSCWTRGQGHLSGLEDWVRWMSSPNAGISIVRSFVWRAGAGLFNRNWDLQEARKGKQVQRSLLLITQELFQLGSRGFPWGMASP